MQPCNKIASPAPYVASTARITAAEKDAAPCFSYVNPGVAEKDLQQFDHWLMEMRVKPQVYCTSWERGKFYSFEACIFHQMVPVDWRVYLTWANTFNRRFRNILDDLQIKAPNNFVGPDAELQIARAMQVGARPIPLAECDLSGLQLFN